MGKTRVLFIVGSLGGGGAERVVLNLARYIDRGAFQPHLALLDCKGDYMDLLPDDVVVHDLKARRARYAFLPLARLIGKLEPDVLFSTTIHVDQSLCLAMKLVRWTPKLIFRSPNFASESLLKAPFFVRRLAHWSYNRADLVIASTQAMSKDLQANFSMPAEKIKVIPNPIDTEMIKASAEGPVDHPWFQENGKAEHSIVIAMGRLVEQKGFSFLLRAFSVVREESPARLVILGRGDQLKELQTLASKLDIDQDVAFLGFQSNPYKYVANADLFVLSSLWEGFPNALVEVMACGIPVVSTDCPSGPSEIITSGENGLLVSPADPDALAEAILRVLRDNKVATKLVEGGKKRAADFDVGRTVGEYELAVRSILEM